MQGNISMTRKIQTAFRRYRILGGTCSLVIDLDSFNTSVTFKFMIILQYLITNKKSGKSKYDRKLRELEYSMSWLACKRG